MWSKIARYLPEFESAVLSALDAGGRPFSLRCRPRPDRAAAVLRLDLPTAIDLPAGPASLLCHRHDERLWNLKSFVLRGELEQGDGGWVFRPLAFIPGVAIGGLWSYVRFLRDGRRTTRRYLETRGLDRPQIPWDDWLAVLSEAGPAGPTPS